MTFVRPHATFLLLLFCAVARPAAALPTMIRLGYTNCAACHIAPQGAGLLNPYGRGIDEAQSFRANDYQMPEGGGRFTQDVRSVTQDQLNTSTGKPLVNVLRSRLMYRNSTELGKGVRIALAVAVENETAARPALKYEPAITPRAAFRSDVVTVRPYLMNALLAYRPKGNMEFSVGRDQLPTGVNIADLGVFVRARNRLGYYDSPLQAKFFWWGKRYQIAPYAFAPSGTEAAGSGEHGGGALAEFDLFGKGRTVAGINILSGHSRNLDRTLIGPYVRLGFGRWGILAEHDYTKRTFQTTSTARFGQNATYGQIFWAAREWLVLSGIGERLKVENPYAEDLVAGRFEVAARLSSEITVSLGARVQRNIITGQTAPSAQIQLALKPVL